MSGENEIHECDVIDLPSARISIINDDILRIWYKSQKEDLTLEQARRHTNAMKELQNGQPFYVMISFLGANVNISNEARDYFAHNSRHAQLRLCQAIVVEGLAQKIVANFYKNFHRPDCPVKVFTTEADALQWINRLRKENSAASIH